MSTIFLKIINICPLKSFLSVSAISAMELAYCSVNMVVKFGLLWIAQQCCSLVVNALRQVINWRNHEIILSALHKQHQYHVNDLTELVLWYIKQQIINAS